MKNTDKPPEEGSPFDRFKELAGKLVRVPKKEVDKKEAAYQRTKTKRKKRRSV